MERESLRGLWKRCITCVFVQNFGFVSQPSIVNSKNKSMMIIDTQMRETIYNSRSCH